MNYMKVSFFFSDTDKFTDIIDKIYTKAFLLSFTYE